MQVDEAPDDEDVRETYNFAPGSFGAVYRADIPVRDHSSPAKAVEGQDEEHDEQANKDPKTPRYKLQSMKWGLIPFWTKRQPDYGSLMRTINCRDDSLIDDRGMWTTMKRRKRCIVVCQGFYEWLKKGPGGKEKIPHFVKRKDGDLMCFAGLWDCVSYEGELEVLFETDCSRFRTNQTVCAGSEDKLYTYTVITTSSNPYLKFLHDRMPVILDPNSPEMKTWLDPSRSTWSKDLQAILKPYEGELECYPVSKAVGKVGNNSPEFIVPIDSPENKSNIANFFANAKKKESPKKEPVSLETKIKDEKNTDAETHGVKRKHAEDTRTTREDGRKQKLEQSLKSPSPQKKMRSATHNTPKKKGTGVNPTDGSQRITNFFKK